MTWQPLVLWHNTHSFDDITTFLCMTSQPLYVQHHIHYIMHHIHIFWHHSTLFMTSHALYLWHHSHYIWRCIHSICVITTTLLMISDQLYVSHHTHFMYAILWTVHNITSTLFDFTPFYLSHYIHCILTSQCIWHHTHDNVNVISAISPTISDTISTVSVSSNPGYQL